MCASWSRNVVTGQWCPLVSIRFPLVMTRNVHHRSHAIAYCMPGVLALYSKKKDACFVSWKVPPSAAQRGIGTFIVMVSCVFLACCIFVSIIRGVFVHVYGVWGCFCFSLPLSLISHSTASLPFSSLQPTTTSLLSLRVFLRLIPPYPSGPPSSCRIFHGCAPPVLPFRSLRFVDIDAFIMNPTFKLEWLLEVAKKQQQTGGIDGWGKFRQFTPPRARPHSVRSIVPRFRIILCKVSNSVTISALFGWNSPSRASRCSRSRRITWESLASRLEGSQMLPARFSGASATRGINCWQERKPPTPNAFPRLGRIYVVCSRREIAGVELDATRNSSVH